MQTDYVQRFLFENLDIRGRLVCLTAAWQRMLDGRDYPEDIAALLGHTTALNILLGANQKGSGRVTLQVQGSGPVKLLVADCTAELRIRGMASYEKEIEEKTPERTLLGDGRLSVTLEDVKSGQLYQSLVPLEGETLEQIFEHYLSQSDLLTRVFPEELMRVFRLYPVEYHCPYDEAKVKDMLLGLGREEVESILAEQGEVVIRNEMCNHEYRFDARAIAELFACH
jgi:molecular chaperone Hsp33